MHSLLIFRFHLLVCAKFIGLYCMCILVGMKKSRQYSFNSKHLVGAETHAKPVASVERLRKMLMFQFDSHPFWFLCLWESDKFENLLQKIFSLKKRTIKIVIFKKTNIDFHSNFISFFDCLILLRISKLYDVSIIQNVSSILLYLLNLVHFVVSCFRKGQFQIKWHVDELGGTTNPKCLSSFEPKLNVNHSGIIVIFPREKEKRNREWCVAISRFIYYCLQLPND